MIDHLKELFASPDEDSVKQGISLLIDLGIDHEIYQTFQSLLDQTISSINK